MAIHNVGIGLESCQSLTKRRIAVFAGAPGPDWAARVRGGRGVRRATAAIPVAVHQIWMRGDRGGRWACRLTNLRRTVLGEARRVRTRLKNIE